MSSGEYLYIISQAQCRYYFSKLDATEPPPFHPGFVSWAKKLASPDSSQDDLVQFIQYFGTHYASEITFGARFMKQHKVSQTKYESLREKDVSVEAQASYSGLFSVGGGFSLNSKQRSAASNFQESVETSTITVGAAPPSNGDAMTWASSVQENPVPTKYSLSPVYDLFTEKFAKLLPGIDLNAMRQRLINTSRNYCWILKKKGKIDSCDNSINLGTTLQGVDVTSFGKYYYSVLYLVIINRTIIWFIIAFVLVSRQHTIWTTNNCPRIMVCSSAIPYQCVLLQKNVLLIRHQCSHVLVWKTADHIPKQPEWLKYENKLGDQIIEQLWTRVSQISWSVSVSQINYAIDLLSTDKFCSSSSTNCLPISAVNNKEWQKRWV